MKNIYEVLREKEADKVRILAEIEALRVVIPLLEENVPDTRNTNGFVDDTHRNIESSQEIATSGERQSSGSWWKLASH